MIMGSRIQDMRVKNEREIVLQINTIVKSKYYGTQLVSRKSDTRYAKYSLVLLAILLCTTIIFLTLWARLYWQYGRFRLAYGVLWDNGNNMHCPSCHKILKPSIDPEKPFLFWCSDPKCNNKCPLKNDEGKMITQKEAIELLSDES